MRVASFLNVRVTRTPNCLKLDQTVFIKKILVKYVDFLGARDKTRLYPLPSDVKVGVEHVHSAEEQKLVDNFPYRPLLGALLYLSMNTRPDISYAVGVLSRFSTKVNITVCKLLMYLMQYVRGTTDKGIHYRGRDFDLHMFTDADWAGDPLTRRSTSGYVMFGAGGPLSWGSKLQSTVATSTMQAEYQCLYNGLQEMIWSRGVTGEVGLKIDEPTPLFLDSQSAQDISENPVQHQRSKHIEIKYHMIREHVDPEQFNTAKLIHVSSRQQMADIYTKALRGPIFIEQRERNLGEKFKTTEQIIAEVPKVKRARRT